MPVNCPAGKSLSCPGFATFAHSFGRPLCAREQKRIACVSPRQVVQTGLSPSFLVPARCCIPAMYDFVQKHLSHKLHT